MIKRTVEVSTSGTYIHLRQGNLVLERLGAEMASIPAEDLGLLILDYGQITASSAALETAVEQGAAVIFCGQDHHPAGLLLPLAGNVLHSQRIREQVDAKLPLVKQLWRQLIKRKLQMQAAALSKESATVDRLKRLAEEVRSGDPDNCEAQGAKLYWSALLGSDFRRFREGAPPNNLLNYGYMILRAATARAICLAGLHPALGLHHHNRENAFCLADDLMEPFRPLVDVRVREMWHGGTTELDRGGKHKLLSLLSDPIFLSGEQGPLMVALQKCANSLSACFRGEGEKLLLPDPDSLRLQAKNPPKEKPEEEDLFDGNNR